MSRQRHARGAVALAALVPLLLGALSLVIVARLEPPLRSNAERRFTIPEGTGARAAAGEPVDDVLPRRITTEVGVALRVENRDSRRHVFGPFVLAPGQSWQREFAAPGAYAFDCSLYPVAGFTIAVDQSQRAEAAALSRRLHLGWALAAALCATVLCGVLGLRAARAAPARNVPRLLGAALPALVLVAGASGLLALSRLSAWGPVLGSRHTIAWAVALVLALGAASLIARLLDPEGQSTPARALPPIGVALLALGALALPQLGILGAGRATLAALGLGFLGSASVSALRGGADGAAQRVATAGLVAFLAALPLPLAELTPPWHATLMLPALAAGATVLYLGAREAAARLPDSGWTLRLAGGAVAFFALATMWWSMIRHLDAVTLPVWGNPTASSAASVAHGASLYQAHCAACHESPRLLPSVTDRRLLELMTHGHADADGLAYELELTERGDVVNYLRSLRVGDEAAAPGAQAADRLLPTGGRAHSSASVP